MTNKEKYDEIFITNFRIDKQQLPNLSYHSVAVWDSIGHMNLVASIEESFSIMLDTDDIISFSSYEGGKEILKKYNLSI